jgi:branched-chain amino acid transport system substrate-binding protein
MRNCLLFNLFLLGFAAGCGRSDPLFLGHIDPKNADDAEYRALSLAVEQTNADPGKQPFERRVQIIHGVAGKKPEEAEGQAVRLAAVDRVLALLGGYRSSMAEIIGKAAQENGVLAFTMSGWPGATSNPFLFPVGASPVDQGRSLARYARDDLKSARVAVMVNDDSPLHKAFADAFTQELGRERFKRFSVPRPAKSDGAAFKEEIDRIVKRVAEYAPDALYLGLDADDALQWASHLPGPEAKVRPVIFGGDEADLAALGAEARPDGWYGVSSMAMDDATPRLQEFVKAYEDKYKVKPPPAAALAYDAYQVLLQGCRKAGEASPAKIREELRKKDATVEVLTGTLSYTMEQTARRPVFVVQIQKGTEKLVKRYEPNFAEGPTPSQ